MINTCEHNEGRMGICSECSKRIDEEVDRARHKEQTRIDMMLAAKLVEKHGYVSIANQIREAADPDHNRGLCRGGKR